MQKTENYASLNKIAILSLFVAFSLFLSSIEYLLPRPVPFFRYGLANIVVLLAIRVFRFRDLFALTLLKVLGLGILNGTFASYVFVFSFLGSMGAFVCMYAISRICGQKISLIGIGVLGALASNSIQIVCAILYIFGTQAWVIAPYLLGLGMISGVVVGLLAQYYWNRSNVFPLLCKRYRDVCNG